MTPSRLKLWSILAGAILVASLPVFAQPSPAPRRGRPVIFSEPQRDAGTTNLDSVTASRSLQNLENQLKKPFEILDVADPSSRTVTVPPVRQLPAPQLENKKMRTLFEKDWAFMTPEDYKAQLGLTPADMLKLNDYNADGTFKTKTTPMEQYYERQQKKARSAETNQANSEVFSDGKEKDKDELFGFDKRRGGTSPLDHPRQLIGNNNGGVTDPTKPRTIADVFGISSADPATPAKAQELRLQEFKRILDPNAVNPGVNLSGTTLGPAVAPLKINPLPGPNGARDSLGFMPSAAITAQKPGLPDAYSKFSAPTLTTPVLERPPVALPSAPGFGLPKRKF